jgi:hypothetical protein
MEAPLLRNLRVWAGVVVRQQDGKRSGHRCTRQMVGQMQAAGVHEHAWARMSMHGRLRWCGNGCEEKSSVSNI